MIKSYQRWLIPFHRFDGIGVDVFVQIRKNVKVFDPIHFGIDECRMGNLPLESMSLRCAPRRPWKRLPCRAHKSGGV